MADKVPSIIEQARERGRRQGRKEERERIIEWLGKVREEVGKEQVCSCLPYSAGGDGPERDCSVHGENAFTEEQKNGALGIITVLVEKLKEA